MSTLLHIDASANPGVSASRALTAEFASAWQAAHPVSAVVHRDLGLRAPPALDRGLLAALRAAPGTVLEAPALEARRASEALIQEFLSADAFVMGVPMYNFSVPAGFKAWIDHVVRFGHTVVRGPRGTEPVVKGRKALVIATRAGDFSPGGAREGWDFVGPYLEKVLGYLGLETTLLPVVSAPGRPDAEERLAAARERMGYVLKGWSAAESEAGREGDGRAAA